MSYEAFVEWGEYLREILVAKKAQIQYGEDQSSNMDLVGQLLKGQKANEDGKPNSSGALTDSEIMGNLFMFIIAGHETSGNSIHFTLIYMALNPKRQQKMQKEIEDIFQGRPLSKWDYDRDLPRLLTGYATAVLNEELRLLAPTVNIPKVVCSEDQYLMVDGKKVTVPANSMARLCVSSVHRNPKFWPHGPPKASNELPYPGGSPKNDLEEFKPERWTPEAGESLYTPVKGSYIPFSDGQRACLGRRFAQVEILVALAVIFSQYSVELAVDEWASDDEVAKMSAEEKLRTWGNAEAKANWILQNKTSSILSLQIRGSHVPVRFVKKGEERFASVIDS
jgi:cytochrome P450